MRNLKHLVVEIDEHSGFCFGVTSAVKKAEEQLEQGEELYCLGEIVHNDEEVRLLEKKGMITINKSALEHLRGKTILFRAHGEPPSTYETVTSNNNRLIDATCPVVLKFQERIRKSYQQGEKIYIFGKPGHAEIIGLNGQINNEGVVFERMEDLDIASSPNQITLYSQTTKSQEKFREIITTLRTAGIQVKVHDTICRQVSNREPYLREFCRRFDKIIFVAGENSSNGKVLFEVCKTANPASYFVSSAGQLDPAWFVEHDRVGICGATSTPLWLMEQVRDVLVSW